MATNVAPRILLIEMPFRSACRPNLGLSLLRACAARAGFECATRYAHFEFARRIGSRRYHAVAEDYADEQLIGDLVF
ncbi:MAG TPA: hypothetical protein VGK73_29445, partial [Polyangiaceae bacterium]